MRKIFLFLLFLLPAIAFEGRERALLLDLEEKVEGLASFLKKMEKIFPHSFEARNQFVVLVEEKNHLLQEITHTLLYQFLVKIEMQDSLYEKKLIAVHQMLLSILQMKESPSWREYQKLQTRLSFLQSLYTEKTLPRVKENQPPRKGKRFLDS